MTPPVFNADSDIWTLEGVDLSRVTDELCTSSSLFVCEQAFALEAWFGRADREVATTLEREFRRFVGLRVRYPQRRLVASGPVDMYWHRLILHQRLHEFVREHIWASVGYRLTHEPIEIGETDQQLECYATTLTLYRRHFGRPPTLIDPRGQAAEVWCSPSRPVGVSSSG